MRSKYVVLSYLVTLLATAPMCPSIAARRCQNLFLVQARVQQIQQKLAKMRSQGVSLPFTGRELEIIHRQLEQNHELRNLFDLHLSLNDPATKQKTEITRLLVSEIALHLKIEPQLDFPDEANVAKTSVVAGLNSMQIRPLRVWAINQWINHAGLRRTLIAVELFPRRKTAEPQIYRPMQARQSDTALMAEPPITTVVYAVFQRGPHHVATEVPGATFHLSETGGANHPKYFIQDTESAMADET